jgi:hypothetical protein
MTQGDENTIFGGWSNYHNLDQEELEIFRDADKLIGVDYDPQEVAIMPFAGMCYLYKCNATIVNREGTKFKAVVQVFKPIGGDPFISYIDKID